MEFILQIPEYNKLDGFVFDWVDNFEIEVNIIEGKVLLTANKEGLMSLAKHLISLSQDAYPKGYDIHLDSYNSLEEGSRELIIQKG